MTQATARTPQATDRAPEPGQQVTVRGHPWVVKGIQKSEHRPGSTRPSDYRPTNLVTLVSLDDDRWEHEIEVIWELETGRWIHEKANLPTPDPDNLDDPEVLGAFLDAVRWGAVTNADKEALQAPFRSGITIEDYQLEPLVRALQMPRVNLLIADDVGLGKTIEAGLVIQELILRHRARTALIICPAPLQQKWKEEMHEKFGLNFEIIDTEYVKGLRRTRGIRANPWTSYPRMITSLDWIKLERPLRMLKDALPSTIGYPRPFDMLVIDEVHNVAPAASGRYATDSLRTQAIREIAPHFEHRLFLSATPHNGYEESWTALLELLDPQRFMRNVRPTDEVRDQSVIRRLKSQFIDDESGEGVARFPRRKIEQIEVEYPDEERQAHADLREYTRLRQGGTEKSRSAGDFIHKLLKKRLFSSPQAFYETLKTHAATVERGRSAKEEPSDRALRSVLTKAEDDYGTEEEFAQAELDALNVAARTTAPLTDEQRKVLDRLLNWAQVAADRPDAKTKALIEWLTAIVKPGGKWSDERVILFTEYRDTQHYLVDQLTAAGLTQGGRLKTLYGGQHEDDRDPIKAAFQASPDLDPVRILLATDTASEGIDLQRQCHRLVHVEIPWNPNRLEQRNGRIDRHGQPHPTADVFHFVGSGFKDAEPGSLEADLEFLARATAKIDRIRNDIGSAGPVIADQVEQAMLGTRSSFDDAAINRKVDAQTKLTSTERRLREKVQELARTVIESRDLLELSPERVERAVNVALELDVMPPLQESTLTRGNTTHRVLRVPALDKGWARTKEYGFTHPVTGDELPITFDHDLAASHDDVVLVHLGHPLVDKALTRLRGEIWTESNSRLSRVSTAVAPDAMLPDDDGAIIAHGRLVITGATGSRLHEAIISAGGQVRNGKWNWIREIDEVNRMLAASTPQRVGPDAVAPITDHWATLSENVMSSLNSYRTQVVNAKASQFAKRADDEADAVKRILTELQLSIEQLFESPEYEQLQLDLVENGKEAERQQLRVNEDALRRRLDEIPAEIEQESAAARERYLNPTARLFPAAITILIPERRARS